MRWRRRRRWCSLGSFGFLRAVTAELGAVAFSVQRPTARDERQSMRQVLAPAQPTTAPRRPSRLARCGRRPLPEPRRGVSGRCRLPAIAPSPCRQRQQPGAAPSRLLPAPTTPSVIGFADSPLVQIAAAPTLPSGRRMEAVGNGEAKEGRRCRPGGGVRSAGCIRVNTAAHHGTEGQKEGGKKEKRNA